jgi:hypothetical protein
MSQDGQSSETTGEGGDNDIHAEAEQGRKYGESVYREINYDSLEEAPETSEYPDTSGESRFRIAEMPKAPKLTHILGPGAILLGAGIGSGETMFWPTIVADSGWAVYWAFWVGVLLKFFLVTETQRWAIATGESIFQGLRRVHGIWPWFFLVLGFFNIGWPGWAATGSEVFAAWTGVVPRADWWIIGIIGITVIWLSYQIGPLLYNIVESVEIILVTAAVSLGILLFFYLGTAGQVTNVPASVVQFGTLPESMDIATFLGGLGYAGAGAYICFTQGVWAREKGYGMGTYQGRVKNPLRGSDNPEEVHSGFTFEPTLENLQRWKEWWKVTQQETFITFTLGILLLTTISASIAVAYVPAGTSVANNGVNMWLNIIIPQLNSIGQFMLYALLFIAMFTTQYGIVEVFMRNSGDIIYEGIGRQRGWQMNNVFFGLLTIFSFWGILIIGFQFQQPWYLLVIGAVVAGAMFWPYYALTIIMNTTRLPEHTQPGWFRTIAMWTGSAFFGYFTIILLATQLVNRFGLTIFETSVSIMGSNIGGYMLWLVYLIIQVYTMYRSAQAKMAAKGTVDNASEGSGFLG